MVRFAGFADKHVIVDFSLLYSTSFRGAKGDTETLPAAMPAARNCNFLSNHPRGDQAQMIWQCAFTSRNSLIFFVAFDCFLASRFHLFVCNECSEFDDPQDGRNADGAGDSVPMS
jgi:hypothetical protein